MAVDPTTPAAPAAPAAPAPAAPAAAATTLLTAPPPEAATTPPPDANGKDAGKAPPAKPEAQTSSTGDEDKAKPPQGEAATDIEIKLPEGITADSGLLEGFKPLAKEMGLKSEQAQKLADLYVARQQAMQAEASEAHQKQVEDWAKAVASDKEIGGAALEATKLAATQAMERFGTAELRDLLEKTGLGNHPALVRAFAAVGKAVAEDSVRGGRHGGAPEPTESERLARFYNNSQPKK